MVQSTAFRNWGIGLGLVLLAGSLLFYLDVVGREEEAAAHGEAVFEPTLGDLYSPWRGTQELLLYGRDPYSEAVTHDIQSVYYGHVLEGAPGEPKDQQRFAYPVYVALLLAPFSHLPFALVRTTFWCLLLAATVFSVPLWLKFAGPAAKWDVMLLVAAMTISSVPVTQGANLQQLGLLVAFLLAASAFLLVRKQLALAGTLLALASIKPQMSVLLTVWLGFWVLSDWRKRKAVLAGFAVTVVVLIFGSDALLPGWISEFLHGLTAYARYTESRSWVALILPGWFAVVAGAIAVAGTVLVCLHARHSQAASLEFALASALVLNLTILVVPATLPTFNQVLLLPGVLVLLAHWRLTWEKDRVTRAALVFLAGVVIAPWVLSIAANFLWLGGSSALTSVWKWPLYPNLIWPLATFAGLFLLADAAKFRASETTAQVPIPFLSNR